MLLLMYGAQLGRKKVCYSNATVLHNLELLRILSLFNEKICFRCTVHTFLLIHSLMPLLNKICYIKKKQTEELFGSIIHEGEHLEHDLKPLSVANNSVDSRTTDASQVRPLHNGLK